LRRRHAHIVCLESIKLGPEVGQSIIVVTGSNAPLARPASDSFTHTRLDTERVLFRHQPMRCRLDFFKQDLIVLTVVGIPNLSSVGVVSQSEEEGFFLNLGQEIVEFDEERKSIVGS